MVAVVVVVTSSTQKFISTGVDAVVVLVVLVLASDLTVLLETGELVVEMLFCNGGKVKRITFFKASVVLVVGPVDVERGVVEILIVGLTVNELLLN